MNRQRLILFILIIIFLIAALWSYSAFPRLKTVEKLAYPPGQQLKPAPATDRKLPQEAYDGRILNIALLEKEQADFNGYRRNIFKPIFVDEQKLAKQRGAAPKPLQLQPIPPQNAMPATPVATKPETAVLARFTFLGFLAKNGQRTIFLAKDKDIILVKKGDKVAGRYEASSITDQALTLLVTDTGDEIVIPLIENRPLAAAR